MQPVSAKPFYGEDGDNPFTFIFYLDFYFYLFPLNFYLDTRQNRAGSHLDT
jgi:hypothetical protein